MNLIVIGIKLQERRFCNALQYSEYEDCPCLRSDDYFGDPESCNLDYDIKIRHYDQKTDEIRDNMEQKVAVRPEICIRAHDLDMEQLKLVIAEMILDNEVPSSPQEIKDDIQYFSTKLCEIFGVSQA